MKREKGDNETGGLSSSELYYLFLHFWLQLTGAPGMIPTEFLVRLPY